MPMTRPCPSKIGALPRADTPRVPCSTPTQVFPARTVWKSSSIGLPVIAIEGSDHNDQNGRKLRKAFQRPSGPFTVAAMASPAIELRGVTKRFATPKGGIYTALRDLNLEVAAGEFCAVVGPTGCGKSTTLALISGLEPASTGEVRLEGNPVKGIADGVGYVFQSDAGFPWKTVLENVAAGPRYHGAPGRDARARAREWITRVGLAGFEDRYPHQLSGGMRKRVGLAQSLINGPRILLMDEPFPALDVQTRTLEENELLSLWSSTSASVGFVTHDLEEAIALADRVVLLTAGPAGGG